MKIHASWVPRTREAASTSDGSESSLKYFSFAVLVALTILSGVLGFSWMSATQAATPADADLNNSGKVDIFDLSILLSNYGNAGQGDVNNSGKVDIFDLSILLSVYNQTVTVTPPTPAPTLTLSASPTSIANGAASTLTWSSTDATSCTASGAWSGSKATSGSQSTGNLTVSSSYTLFCTGDGGSVSKTANVTVAGAPTPPSVTITASPTSIAYNASSTITWSSTNATSCTASGDWSGAKATSGSQSTGNLTSTAIYNINCTGAGGNISRGVTVTVAAAPAPTATLSASPTSIAYGASSTLTWSSTNATSCTATGGWAGTQATSGSQSTGNLSSDTTYNLSCTGVGGTVNKSVTVAVAAPPAPTVTLTANPSGVTSGSASTLTWSSTNASSCTASGSWTGTKATSGTQSTGNLTANATYNLSCTGAGGSASKSVTVPVTALPAPTVTFTANPTSVVSGSASTLTWSSTNATSCTASGGWTGTKATSGTASTGNLTADATFSLSCTGSGGSTSKSVTVTVAAATPAPTVNLTATPTSVSSGSNSTLSWTTTNATSCTASGAWSGTKATSGSEVTASLTASSTYTLTCTGTGGNGNDSATVTVAAATGTSTIINDANASGGQALRLNVNATATKTTTTKASTAIAVFAKGDQCNGAPTMVLKIDGTTVATQDVAATTYTSYITASTIAAGSHVITIQYTNDTSTTSCDRNLIIDKVEFTPSGGTTNLTLSGLSDGATISGSKIIQLNSSGMSGIASVDYLIDGQVSTTENNEPFCLGGDDGTNCNQWDSTTLSNGAHTLQFKVYNSSDTLIGSTPVINFTVSNTAGTPTPSPPTGSTGDRNPSIPFGMTNVNDYPLNGGAKRYAIRFVLPRDTVIAQFLSGFKSAGASFNGGGCSSYGPGCYGAGNGGVTNAYIVDTKANGDPDMTKILAQDSGRSSQTISSNSPNLFMLAFNMGNVSLQGGHPYAIVFSNTGGSPANNYISNEGITVNPSAIGPNGCNYIANSSCAGTKRAIAGLDPREAVIISENSGSTWSYGQGGDGSDNGPLLPWFGWKTSSGAVQANQPYWNYNVKCSNCTMVATNATEAQTITQAGGYVPSDGGSAGTITVSVIHGGTTTTATTAPGGTGMVVGNLSKSLSVAVGDKVTVKASGTVYQNVADSANDGVFNLGAGDFPFTDSGGSASNPQLFVLPWPFYKR